MSARDYSTLIRHTNSIISWMVINYYTVLLLAFTRYIFIIIANSNVQCLLGTFVTFSAIVLLETLLLCYYYSVLLLGIFIIKWKENVKLVLYVVNYF